MTRDDVILIADVARFVVGRRGLALLVEAAQQQRDEERWENEGGAWRTITDRERQFLAQLHQMTPRQRADLMAFAADPDAYRERQIARALHADGYEQGADGVWHKVRR